MHLTPSHCCLIAVSSPSHRRLIAVSSPSHRRLIVISSSSHRRLIVVSSPSHRRLIAVSSPSHRRLIAVSSPSHRRLIIVSSSSHRHNCSSVDASYDLISLSSMVMPSSLLGCWHREQGLMIWSTVCSGLPQLLMAESLRPQHFMVAEKHPTLILRWLSMVYCLRGRSSPRSLPGSFMNLCSLD